MRLLDHVNTTTPEKSSIIVRESMIRSHRWKKITENSQLLWRDSIRSQGQGSAPISVEHCSVEHENRLVNKYRAWTTLDRMVNITVVFIGRMHLLHNI